MRWLAHDRGLARGHSARRRLIVRSCDRLIPSAAVPQRSRLSQGLRVPSAPPTGGAIPAGNVGPQWTSARSARWRRQGWSSTCGQELYGESDPTTFDAMLQLGRALRDAGKLREAERVLTTSLALQNRSAEHDEARVRWTDFNLAIVLDRLGEHEAARRLWERVLESSDRDDGPDSELSRQTATNLAITLRKLRRYGDEFPLRVRVLDSTRRSLGPDGLETIKAEIDLAESHRHLGNHEMALGLFSEALAGLERNGADQRMILYQKWAVATELVALKRSEEASLMFDQVVAGAVEHLEPDDPLRRSAAAATTGLLAPRQVLATRPEANVAAHHAPGRLSGRAAEPSDGVRPTYSGWHVSQHREDRSHPIFSWDPGSCDNLTRWKMVPFFSSDTSAAVRRCSGTFCARVRNVSRPTVNRFMNHCSVWLMIRR